MDTLSVWTMCRTALHACSQTRVRRYVPASLPGCERLLCRPMLRPYGFGVDDIVRVMPIREIVFSHVTPLGENMEFITVCSAGERLVGITIGR